MSCTDRRWLLIPLKPTRECCPIKLLRWLAGHFSANGFKDYVCLEPYDDDYDTELHQYSDGRREVTLALRDDLNVLEVRARSRSGQPLERFSVRFQAASQTVIEVYGYPKNSIYPMAHIQLSELQHEITHLDFFEIVSMGGFSLNDPILLESNAPLMRAVR